LSSSDIANRYSEALFQIASEEKNYEKYFNDLKAFSAVVEEKRESTEKSCSTPFLIRTRKKAVVGDLLQMIGVFDISANFLRLLVDKGRISFLGEIVTAYQQLMDTGAQQGRG